MRIKKDNKSSSVLKTINATQMIIIIIICRNGRLYQSLLGFQWLLERVRYTSQTGTYIGLGNMVGIESNF